MVGLDLGIRCGEAELTADTYLKYLKPMYKWHQSS